VGTAARRARYSLANSTPSVKRLSMFGVMGSVGPCVLELYPTLAYPRSSTRRYTMCGFVVAESEHARRANMRGNPHTMSEALIGRAAF